jgi:hypothetical protein
MWFVGLHVNAMRECIGFNLSINVGWAAGNDILLRDYLNGRYKGRRREELQVRIRITNRIKE